MSLAAAAPGAGDDDPLQIELRTILQQKDELAQQIAAAETASAETVRAYRSEMARLREQRQQQSHSQHQNQNQNQNHDSSPSSTSEASSSSSSSSSSSNSNNIRTRLKTLEDAKREADVNRLRLERELASARSMRDKLTEKLGAARRGAARALDEAAHQERQHEELATSLVNDRALIEERLKSRRAKMAELQERSGDRDQELDKIRGESAELEAILEGARQEEAMLKNALLHWQASREKMRMEIKARAELLHQMRAEFQTLQSTLREETRQKMALLEELGRLKRESDLRIEESLMRNFDLGRASTPPMLAASHLMNTALVGSVNSNSHNDTGGNIVDISSPSAIPVSLISSSGLKTSASSSPIATSAFGNGIGGNDISASGNAGTQSSRSSRSSSISRGSSSGPNEYIASIPLMPLQSSMGDPDWPLTSSAALAPSSLAVATSSSSSSSTDQYLHLLHNQAHQAHPSSPSPMAQMQKQQQQQQQQQHHKDIWSASSSLRSQKQIPSSNSPPPMQPINHPHPHSQALHQGSSNSSNGNLHRVHPHLGNFQQHHPLSVQLPSSTKGFAASLNTSHLSSISSSNGPSTSSSSAAASPHSMYDFGTIPQQSIASHSVPPSSLSILAASPSGRERIGSPPINGPSTSNTGSSLTGAAPRGPLGHSLSTSIPSSSMIANNPASSNLTSSTHSSTTATGMADGPILYSSSSSSSSSSTAAPSASALASAFKGFPSKPAHVGRQTIHTPLSINASLFSNTSASGLTPSSISTNGNNNNVFYGSSVNSLGRSAAAGVGGHQQVTNNRTNSSMMPDSFQFSLSSTNTSAFTSNNVSAISSAAVGGPVAAGVPFFSSSASLSTSPTSTNFPAAASVSSAPVTAPSAASNTTSVLSSTSQKLQSLMTQPAPGMKSDVVRSGAVDLDLLQNFTDFTPAMSFHDHGDGSGMDDSSASSSSSSSTSTSRMLFMQPRAMTPTPSSPIATSSSSSSAINNVGISSDDSSLSSSSSSQQIQTLSL